MHGLYDRFNDIEVAQAEDEIAIEVYMNLTGISLLWGLNLNDPYTDHYLCG